MLHVPASTAILAPRGVVIPRLADSDSGIWLSYTIGGICTMAGIH